MLATLNQWDQDLFLLLNGWHHELVDPVMAFVSEKWVWIPLYAVLLFLIFRKLGWQGTLWTLLAIGVLITMSDQFASGFLKPTVARFRPCRTEALGELVHIVNGHCGGKYGFASSHAANFFALATFMSRFLQKPSWTIALFGAAVLTAYSRVYLGVHYPADVIFGALIGIVFGSLIWYSYARFIGPLLSKPALPPPFSDQNSGS
ncbi:MAG: phosphatase PAP2 family protein [Bacteroidota bacterium]